jgi:methionine biosynthesis protein MetW
MKIDYKIISAIIEPGSRVLDLGTGSGELLAMLVKEKNIKAQGIEINEGDIYRCVEKGLSVCHSDFESSLGGFTDKSFDYVILNESMQEAKELVYVLEEALRVGEKVIVGFPNFVYIAARLMFFFKGKAPMSRSLPYRWFDTPNLRFLSIKDFRGFCQEKNIGIIESIYFNENKTVKFMPNIFAQSAIFVVQK